MPNQRKHSAKSVPYGTAPELFWPQMSMLSTKKMRKHTPARTSDDVRRWCARRRNGAGPLSWTSLSAWLPSLLRGPDRTLACTRCSVLGQVITGALRPQLRAHQGPPR